MAGYRPKSLDELNSLYDKSVNVKNEIDKKTSDLEIRQEISAPVTAAAPEQPPVQQTAPEEAQTGGISGLVDDFIKNFGETEVKRVRPVAPTTLRAVSSAKSEEPEADNRKAVHAAADKPKLIRNSERNDLFENYKKVMDDEDEEEYSRHRLGRKRNKKRSEKKTDTVETQPQSTVEPTAAAEAEADTAAAEEIPETLENIGSVIDKVLGKPSQQEAEDEAAEEIVEAVYEVGEAEPQEYETVQQTQEPSEENTEAYEESVSSEEPEEAYEPEEEPAEEENEAVQTEESATAYEEAGRKSFKGKNLLLFALLSVLLLATAVSAVKAFAGINSDILVLGKYHLYSADENYAQARIKKGDLVAVVNDSIKEGEIFAYKKGDSEYGFAELQGILNEDSVIADKDGQKSIVFKSTLRGVIYKIYPAVGTFASLVAAYYLYIIGALFAVAAVLIIVLAVVYRKRKAVADGETEIYPEEYQSEADEEAELDAVEGDFRYLIRDEEEDDFNIYRQDDGDEGLPVYEAEAYKYEPDEYVNN